MCMQTWLDVGFGLLTSTASEPDAQAGLELRQLLVKALSQHRILEPQSLAHVALSQPRRYS
jgi:hypothetical protein